MLLPSMSSCSHRRITSEDIKSKALCDLSLSLLLQPRLPLALTKSSSYQHCVCWTPSGLSPNIFIHQHMLSMGPRIGAHSGVGPLHLDCEWGTQDLFPPKGICSLFPGYLLASSMCLPFQFFWCASLLAWWKTNCFQWSWIGIWSCINLSIHVRKNPLTARRDQEWERWNWIECGSWSLCILPCSCESLK